MNKDNIPKIIIWIVVWNICVSNVCKSSNCCIKRLSFRIVWLQNESPDYSAYADLVVTFHRFNEWENKKYFIISIKHSKHHVLTQITYDYNDDDDAFYKGTVWIAQRQKQQEM